MSEKVAQHLQPTTYHLAENFSLRKNTDRIIAFLLLKSFDYVPTDVHNI